MIYRVPSFPLTPPLPSAICLSFSVFLSPGELSDGGEGVGMEPNLTAGSKAGQVIWFLATLNKGYSSATVF